MPEQTDVVIQLTNEHRDQFELYVLTLMKVANAMADEQPSLAIRITAPIRGLIYMLHEGVDAVGRDENEETTAERLERANGIYQEVTSEILTNFMGLCSMAAPYQLIGAIEVGSLFGPDPDEDWYGGSPAGS